jgi:16S rRNA (guanine527-N7)-methyltransferase
MMLDTTASVGGVTVSRETFHALQQLEALVRKWTPAINLVSKATLSDLWDRHIVDSAQLFSACPTGATYWADLGSGGGFPGLVIAIIASEKQPDLKVTLVEADQRKAAFLRQAAQSLSLPVTVICGRIEALAPLEADIVSARALAPLSDLLGHAVRHMRPGGTALFPKGSRHEEELMGARTSWAFQAETRQSVSDPKSAILVIRNIHRARQD